MKKFGQYHKAVTYLESLPQFFGKVDDPSINMRRVRRLLDLLGKPDKDMKVIHITGTAGKGTVANLVHSAIVNSGNKSGLFTSPYSTSQIEEIQVGDLYIDPVRFASIVESIKPHVEEMKNSVFGSPSIFEVIFTIALFYFKEEKVDWVVLEVGLGGMFDATNIFPSSKVSAITNIGSDHIDILGGSLESIARDKAGIIKKGSTFFTTETRPALQEYFRSVCEDVGAVYYVLPSKKLSIDEKNRLLAQKIVAHLGIKNTYFEKAVVEVRLPGRFEILNREKTVILDGAHNVIKMDSVISKLKSFADRKINLVIAISEDKEIKGILDKLIPKVNKVYITSFTTTGRKSMSMEKVEEVCKTVNPDVQIELIKDPILAFKRAEQEGNRDDVTLVTGSFYLIEVIRNIFYPEEFILMNRRSK